MAWTKRLIKSTASLGGFVGTCQYTLGLLSNYRALRPPSQAKSRVAVGRQAAVYDRDVALLADGRYVDSALSSSAVR